MMTRESCAAALNGKRFHEIFELTENFLADMQESGLFLCFCPDKMYFHILGAHQEIVPLSTGTADNGVVCVQLQGGEGKVSFTLVAGASDCRGQVISPSWKAIEDTAGYVLQTSIPSEQVWLREEGRVCLGLVFSKADLYQE